MRELANIRNYTIYRKYIIFNNFIFKNEKAPLDLHQAGLYISSGTKPLGEIITVAKPYDLRYLMFVHQITAYRRI